MTSFARAERDIRQWLLEDKLAHATTMFDLYGLPRDFPGQGSARKATDVDIKIQILEDSLSQAINDRRFIPYIQKHEFEALLFSDVNEIDQALMPVSGQSQIDALQQIRLAFKSPEEIDDHPDSAPSKRLINLYPGYDKEAWGTVISTRIGIGKIRSECPHFNQWLTRLEALH